MWICILNLSFTSSLAHLSRSADHVRGWLAFGMNLHDADQRPTSVVIGPIGALLQKETKSEGVPSHHALIFDGYSK